MPGFALDDLFEVGVDIGLLGVEVIQELFEAGVVALGDKAEEHFADFCYLAALDVYKVMVVKP